MYLNRKTVYYSLHWGKSEAFKVNDGLHQGSWTKTFPIREFNGSNGLHL